MQAKLSGASGRRTYTFRMQRGWPWVSQGSRPRYRRGLFVCLTLGKRVCNPITDSLSQREMGPECFARTYMTFNG